MPTKAKTFERPIKSALSAKSRARRKRHESAVALDNAVTIVTRNDLQPQLVVVDRSIDALSPAKRRARSTSDDQLTRVVRSVGEFQQVLPILIDTDDRIIAGHVIWEALRRLDRPTIQCIVVSHLSDEQQRMLAIAHNRLAETGEWDVDALRLELQDLAVPDIDLTLTGFSIPEVDIIMIDPAENESRESEPSYEGPRVAELGDLFVLGDHRLLCGDALAHGSYPAVMGDDIAACVFSDPPYNCAIAGNVSGLGQHKHQDFQMAVGEMSNDQFTEFLGAYLDLCRQHSTDGAVLFACMDWRQIHHLYAAGDKAGLKLVNLAVWNKAAGGMGAHWRSAHKLITVFVNGEKPATNNVELGRHGRDRTNVWTYPGANRPGSSAAKALADHPTPKPVQLIVDALLDVTARGAVVLDPFMGSGSTLIACEQSARVARGIELDPKYVDGTIRRWQDMTKLEAIHADTGRTYAELAASRAKAEE